MSSTLSTADARRRAFMRDVVAGLSKQQKTLPSRWLYDERGSALFEQITQLEEYYPTRTETALLSGISEQIADVASDCRRLVEYGAGSAIKTEILLTALSQVQAYLPIDIAAEFLADTTTRLRQTFPDLGVCPIVGDFTSSVEIDGLTNAPGPSLGFFPGSTIGNLSNREIETFLRAARQTLGTDGRFLIGADLVKDTDVLLAAYNDRLGITAEFNRNLLARMNRELGADVAISQFAHEARWNPVHSRIEMHLHSLADQIITIGSDQFSFRSGETIHTENSRKFTRETLSELAQSGGWQMTQIWTDPREWFAVILLA